MKKPDSMESRYMVHMDISSANSSELKLIAEMIDGAGRLRIEPASCSKSLRESGRLQVMTSFSELGFLQSTRI